MRRGSSPENSIKEFQGIPRKYQAHPFRGRRKDAGSRCLGGGRTRMCRKKGRGEMLVCRAKKLVGAKREGRDVGAEG